MSWIFLDDKFHSNPKVVAAKLDGAGLYARALAYCGDHLTDGYVPKEWAEEVAPKRLRQRLADVGLWTENGGRYHIPDYLDFNPSRMEVEEKRRKEAERKAAWRASLRSPSGTDGGTDAGTPAVIPERRELPPTPTPKILSSRAKALSRKPDELWEALITVFGEPLTTNEQKRLNGVCKQLRGANATPAQISSANRAWAVEFPDATLTDTALAKHWTRLVRRIEGEDPVKRLMAAAQQREQERT